MADQRLLREAFALLKGFNSLSAREKRTRLIALEKLRSAAEENDKAALLAMNEADQIRKQQACMLLQLGDLPRGLEVIDSIVSTYESQIRTLHEQAAFQLAEAAIACGDKRQEQCLSYGRAALAHAGATGAVSHILLRALDLVQAAQEAQTISVKRQRKK